jgi:NifU-like protein involved in Fe-S cluster formation
VAGDGVSADDPRYGDEVRRRMGSLAGAGGWAPADDVLIASAGDREQGAEVQLSVRLVADRAAALRFRAFGCPHLLAAASWITDRLRGSGRSDLATWDWHEAAEALEVPPAKYGRLLILQDAVHGLARNWPDETGSTV